MKTVITALLLFIGTFSFSQQRLTLPDAINIALKNNPGLKIANNNIAISNIGNTYGFAGGLPVVLGTGSDNEQVTNLNQKLNTGTEIDRSGSASNSAALGVAGSVLVFNGGKVVTEKKRLDIVEAQTHDQYTSRGLTVVSNVMVRYYDIIRQQGLAKTLLQSIDASKKKLEIVKTQQSVGLANNSDLFQAQLDLNAQLQLLQAQQLVIDQDKTDLLTLLNLRPDSTVTISDTIIVDRNVKLDSVLKHLAINPDLLVADQQIRINELLQTETDALRAPAVSATAGYTFGRTQNQAGNVLFNQSYGPYVGLNFSVPIFNGGNYKRQSKIAGINTANSKLLRDTIVISFTSAAVKNWEAYNNNLKQLETQQKNYDLSVQLLDLVLQRFQLRQATILDLNLAQQTFENAAYSLVNIAYAAKIAEIQLKKLSNQLSF